MTDKLSIRSDSPVSSRADLSVDSAALAEVADRLEKTVANMPRKNARSPKEQRDVQAVLASVRRSRRLFLDCHIDAVYDTLTGSRTIPRRISELLVDVAAKFPGLVPSQRIRDAESGRIQAEKEGWDIDIALFYSMILSSPLAGRHLIDSMRAPALHSMEYIEQFSSTGIVELPTVHIERIDCTAHITFRNGSCLNAEDNQLTEDIETAVDLVLLDDKVRVGVLRGGEVDLPRYRGRRVFSAGINLTELRNGNISFVDFILGRELGYINKILRGGLVGVDELTLRPREVQKPWIGVVDTFAIGGGVQLLLVLDHVIAETTAFFSLPAAAEGIVPGLANLRLTKAAGGRLARQLILGGRRIDAADPDARFLCDQVVPPDQIDAALDTAIRDLSSAAAVVNRRMLTLAEEPIDRYREYLAEFAVVQAERMQSSDVLAKIERRWQDRRRRPQ
ncbi:enoyl-CoA hydratase/isomerase family protein [Nocardia brasiliensis]|uniref:enoyl-CoA hydratase/isomerase family protein n=1 Tax=Nocardia brasiliensis TaxID=37326 RepID=UPI002453D03D|nr:enoyl-CoA hydratase/isomerase family protein [Nocardia brasiliensis]